MHQPIPQPVINLYHKQVHQPCTNLYHKQVHPTMYQVCTNHVSTTHQISLINMYQHHQLYTSCMCQLINYLYQPCTSTKIPHQFHHPNLICSSVIDLVYMITFLQTFLNFNNKRLAFSSNFSFVSHA
jgi:hypothetical protein